MRLYEKGGKVHEVPCHHRLDEYLPEYIATAGLEADKKGLLFRSVANRKATTLTDQPLAQSAVHAMIRRRTAAAGIHIAWMPHATRYRDTASMEGGGRLEVAQQIANHESSRTTKLYDRSSDENSLDEVEKTCS